MTAPDSEGTELEGQLADAVARVLSGSEITDDSVRHLCETTALVLQAFLRQEASWPSARFVDGLMPISIDASAERGLEMAAATIVAHGNGNGDGESWVVEPLLVRFAVGGAQVLDFAILFADTGREPKPFSEAFNYAELHFPIEEDSWQFRFGVEPMDPV